MHANFRHNKIIPNESATALKKLSLSLHEPGLTAQKCSRLEEK